MPRHRRRPCGATPSDCPGDCDPPRRHREAAGGGCRPRRSPCGAAARCDLEEFTEQVADVLDPGRLTVLLHGRVRGAVRPRGGAGALAVDLPAPVLADLLGISVSAATRWSALAAHDHADYHAARIAHPPQ